MIIKIRTRTVRARARAHTHTTRCTLVAAAVVRMVLEVSGNRPNATSSAPETSLPITINWTQLILFTVIGRFTFHIANVIHVRYKGPCPPRENICLWRIWAFLFFLHFSFVILDRQRKQLGRFWTSLVQSTWSAARKCLFAGSQLRWSPLEN